MSETTKYPNNFADAVYRELKRRKKEPPSIELLIKLFESMYFASLKTEEAENITFHIVYINPENPDPKPPKNPSKDRWDYIEFSEEIPFNIANIIKLAKASDPRTSSLAIYNDNDNLNIWGLIDQGNRYHDFVNFEVEAGPDRPGIFQASIEAPGHIVAYLGYKKIAELRLNRIVKRSSDVMQVGPIRKELQVGIDRYISSVKRKIDSDAYNDRDHWDESLSGYWISTLCRLLLRTKNHKHGGAILFPSSPPERGLNIKYPIRYSRLRTSLISRGCLTIERTHASDLISIHIMEDDGDIPLDLYLDETVSESNLCDVRSEIDGALWFISLLTRVDGLILMTKHLVVRGFGVEIKTAAPPEKVLLSETASIEEHQFHEIDYNHFGTRHRSMMRYCYRYPGSVGFVISQDGDVRVMTRVNDSLVIWEDIKLQLNDFIRRRLIRGIKRKKQNGS